MFDHLTSAHALRWFPWKLYSYVFGSAAVGWGIGVSMSTPTITSLIASFIGCVLCIAGFFGMRPYMQASQAVVKELNATRAANGSDQ